MKCPNCNNEMIQVEKYWFCGRCRNSIEVSDTFDNDNFNMNALNNFPTIIAHEYHRLKELYTAGQSYGTFMQIKDVYEVIIKFPVIIMIEGLIYSLKNEEKFENRNSILRLFIAKPLSLGDWEVIAKSISKLDNDELPKRDFDLYAATRDHLKEVMKLFKIRINGTEKIISSWRNDEIAHGALSFDDADFRDEIKYMIDNIHRIMEKSEKYYLNMEMIDDKGVIYEGHEIKSINQGDEYYIKYNISSSENAAILSPFIHTESYTYMFDSFSNYSNTAYRLNYSHGKKDKCYRTVDTLLELKKALNIEELDNEYIQRENHLTLQLEKIEEILKAKRIIKPNYLNEYLKSKLGYDEKIKGYKKGVFMIRAERGMGKTVFTKILDDLDYTSTQEDSPSFYSKVIKRVYHINNTYGSELSTFKHILQNDLCSTLEKTNAYIGQIRDEFSRLDSCDDLETLKRQFSKILNMAFEELNRVYFKETGIKREKFLLIIDGLDELDYKYEKNGKTVLDFIPRPDMLNDDIYVLLTSRLPGELKDSERLHMEIEKIELTETAELVTRGSKSYITLLNRHLEKNLLISDEKVQEELLKSLDYRFSYLGAFAKLYSSNLFEKEQINTKNIIKSYLDYLGKNNIRHYENVKRLLLILAVTPVGVRIDELCYLMNENDVSYKLLGTIADMSNFIESKREFGVTVMSISHQDWKEELLQNYNREMTILVEEYGREFNIFYKKILQDSEAEGSIEFQRDFDKFRGQFYILINYVSIRQFIYTRNGIILSDDQLRMNVETLNKIKTYLEVKDKNQERLMARVNFLSGNIAEIHSIKDKSIIDNVNLGLNYFDMGQTLYTLNRLEEALMEFERAIEVTEKLDIDRGISDQNNLAKMYAGRGQVLTGLFRLKEAQVEYEKAIHILNDSDKDDELSDKITLAKAHMNNGLNFEKGIVLSDEKRALKAISEYIKAMEILAKLYKEGRLVEREDLTKVYMHVGELLSTARLYDDTLEMYEKAKEILLEVDKEGKYYDKNLLANIYTKSGMTLLDMYRPKEAREYCKKAITILEQLNREGKLSDKNDLAEAYMNNGFRLSRHNYVEKAVVELDKAIKIREKLYKERKLQDRNDLAILYTNKLLILPKTNRQEALIVQEKSLEILRELHKQTKLYEESDKFNGREEEIVAYGKQIERETIIFELFDRVGMLSNRSILGDLYEKRGWFLKRLNRLDEAVKEFKKAAEVREKLDKEGKLANIKDLISTYADKGLMLHLSNHLVEALMDYGRAIQLIDSLMEEARSEYKNILTDLLNNRACIYRRLSNFESAITDINRAVMINPNAYYCYVTLAEINADLNNEEKFFESIEKAFQLKNSSEISLEDSTNKKYINNERFLVLVEKYK